MVTWEWKVPESMYGLPHPFSNLFREVSWAGSQLCLKHPQELVAEGRLGGPFSWLSAAVAT